MLPLPDDQVHSVFLIFLHAMSSPTNVAKNPFSHEYRTVTDHANGNDTALWHRRQAKSTGKSESLR